ncbi:MAG: hypothetical protein AAB214_02870, partial [Fibrobacterota bacterium]
PRAVAGSSSETENILTARLLRVDSLLPEWNRPTVSPTVATLRLDSSNFPFALVSASGSEIVVERLDSTPIPFRTVFWDKQAKRARLEVRIDPAILASGTRLRLRWNAKDSTRSDSTKVWSALPDSQRQILTSVLVDDFEHSDLGSRLPGSGTWYTLAADSAVITQPEIVTAPKGRTGNVLHYSYACDKGYCYAGLPLAMGLPRSLRTLDSIVFWVKGPAKLAVSFDHKGVGKAWVHRMIDSNWTRLALGPNSIDTNTSGGNIGWNRVRDSVTDLSFFVAQGSNLWLDDIRFHGPNRDDLK